MTNGTVKFFNAAKGFGFITPDGDGKDVFVPAASVAASGIAGLKPGQRVSFESEPDSKGPKAVQLKLLASPPPPAPARPQANHALPANPAPPAREMGSRFTVYVDPDTDEADAVLDALQAAGQEALVVDYIAAPPSRDELKNLSILLRGSDQSLVRKYDPLFRELCLDDRFISDSEFWTAVFEHPALINGPVLATAHKARVCRSGNDVKSFLGLPVQTVATAKPKEIPGRLAALVSGSLAPAGAMAAAVNLPTVQEQKIHSAPAKAVAIAVPNAAPQAAKKSKPEAARQAKPLAKPLVKALAKAQPETKIVLKAAKPAQKAKKAAPKPAKKPVRTAKKK